MLFNHQMQSVTGNGSYQTVAIDIDFADNFNDIFNFLFEVVKVNYNLDFFLKNDDAEEANSIKVQPGKHT